MRIAFFGLAYHQRTRSSRFILDLLARQGTVETFFAEADPADLRRRAAGFDESRYDAIIVWQLHEAFALLSGRHPNVTFAPMYDAMFRGGAFRWRHRYGTAKILCFSWALRQEVMRRAPHHFHVQYYPEAGPRSAACDDPALRGFLWYRHRAVTPERVFALTAGAQLAQLAIHDAPDPGHAIAADWTAPPHVGRLLRTEWSEDRSAFDANLAAANLFFASRPLEGIGMSFLEAMGAGLCVVAPDAPTMNEYISHGRTGLLYAPGREAPLDLSEARAMGTRARDSVLRGRERWEQGVPALLDVLLTPAGRPKARAATPQADADLAILEAGDTLPAARWILFRPPGETLTEEAALHARIAAAPEADIIIGHHLQAMADGSEAFHRPAAPRAAWARLLEGEGPHGIPITAATAFRRDVLLRLGAGMPRSDAELLDLLLRAEESGAVIVEAEEVLARRAPTAQDAAAWAALLRRRVGEDAARRFEAARQAPRQGATPAALMLGLVSTLDRLSPRLADALEGLLLGSTVRRLRGLLRGRAA